MLAGLGLFIGLECLQLYWWRNVMVLAEPMMNFFGPQHVATNPQTMAIMTSWSLWEFLPDGAALDRRGAAPGRICLAKTGAACRVRLANCL